MVQLKRDTGRLLRTVQNKRHATNDDHDEDIEPPRKSPKVSAALGRFHKYVRQPTNDDDDPLSSSDSDRTEDVHGSIVSSADNIAASSTTSADIEGDFAPRRRTVRSSARPSESSAITNKVMSKNLKQLHATTDGSTDQRDDDKMAEWSSDRKRRKPQKMFGATPNNFHVRQSASQSSDSSIKAGYKTPRASIGEMASKQVLPAFKSPPKARKPEPEATPVPGQTFKIPKIRSNVDADSTRSPRRATRSSKRIAGEGHQDHVSEPGSGFKSVPSLGSSNMQGLTELEKQFGVRRLDASHDAGVAAHFSQHELDHIDAADDAGLEDTQILSGDDEDTMTCPYCQGTISDPDLMQKLKRTRHMAMSKQASFCRSHRKAEAQRQWVERGYPDIDWDALPSRIDNLKEHVMQIVRNERDSHFRVRLEERLASGGGRSMLQALSKDASSMDALIPGYYGGRGAKLISNTLMSTFSSDIRDSAGRDKVIGAVGASGFVQAVLVSEVAVKLIMTDLDCDERTAVQVLQESGEMGDLLFEEDEERRAGRSE